MAKWSVEIDEISHGGLAPNYWREDYPRYGNNNMAGDMTAMDCTNHGYIQPGPNIVIYPGSAANITTTIRGVSLKTNSSTIGYGVGGDKIYKIDSTSPSATLVHTVSAISSGYTLCYDIAQYDGYQFYTWVDYANGIGDIGRFDISTFDDTYWSGTLSATKPFAVSGYGDDSPMAMTVGNNDVLYFTNSQYIGSFDGTTAQDKALDFPYEYESQDVRWMNDRLYIPTRHSRSGQTGSSIFVWDGTTDSWETEVIVNGTVGAGYVLNGVYYQFYVDTSLTNKLAYLNGSQVIDVTSYEGSKPPRSYQVFDWKGFIVWVAGPDSADMYAYGSTGDGEPARLFHFADTGTAGVDYGGGVSRLFSDQNILVANNGQLYYLDIGTTPTYETTNSIWKSLLFDITSDQKHGGNVNGIRFNFEKLTSGSSLNWSLVNNNGTTIYSDTISYAKAIGTNEQHSLTSAYYSLNGLVSENFRVELDYSGGSSSAPVRVTNIKVYGES